MKNDLRKKFKDIRKAFIGKDRNFATEIIAQYFISNFSEYNSFFIYNSFGSEVNTSNIIATLLAINKKIYLPKIISGEMFAVPYSTQFTQGAFGIKEPLGEPFLGEIQVAIIPLLCVNNNGFRLGYGGGFYDKFLKNKNIIKVGVAFSIQLTKLNFEEEWDEPLDYLITENGVISFKDKNKEL